MDGSVLEEKPSFKILWLTLSSKLDWSSYIIFIAKTASKKIGTLICSMKSLSPEVALYLCKSTACPCMEYCYRSVIKENTTTHVVAACQKNVHYGMQFLITCHNIMVRKLNIGKKKAGLEVMILNYKKI